jgi:hypothetical protein
MAHLYWRIETEKGVKSSLLTPELKVPACIGQEPLDSKAAEYPTYNE